MPRDAEAARFFSALGDPTRLALLELLRAGDRNVGELVAVLGCPQPKVSRHLRVLKDAGLVRDARDGRNVAYALTAPRAWPAAARAWVERLEGGMPLAERPAGRVAPVPPAAAPNLAEGSSAAPRRPRPGQIESHLL